VALAVAVLLAAAPAVGAADAPDAVALGESNTPAQRDELLGVFGAGADAPLVPVTVAETLAAMDGAFDLSGVDTAYSSAAVTCAAAGSGVVVETRNIEVVPPALYALAVATSGIADVRLVVAAPDDAPALGMTALTGVFKAWDAAPCARGGDDPERRALAVALVGLVADLGLAREEEDAVRRATGLVQAAQERVAGGDAATAAAVGAVVDAGARDAGLELTGAERGRVVTFLVSMATAGIDWGDLGRGWSLTLSGDGTGARLAATRPRPGPAAAEAVATGVGGPVGALASAATGTPATPAAAPTPAATPTAPAAAGSVSDPGGGTVGEGGSLGSPGEGGGRSVPRWAWAAGSLLLLALPLALLLAVILRRRGARGDLFGRVPPAVAAAAAARRRAGTAGSAADAGGARSPPRSLTSRRWGTRLTRSCLRPTGAGPSSRRRRVGETRSRPSPLRPWRRPTRRAPFPAWRPSGPPS
jgi:uncharacterized protein YpuA (DUF1002 family)